MGSRRSAPALIVAGMHRSGTSIVALALQQLGVDLGPDVDESNSHNPAGFGEHRDVVALHRRMFEHTFDDGGDESAGHHHDWGYHPDEDFDPAAFSSIAEEVDEWLDADASASGGVWGWKDPRTALVLDEWVSRLDQPHILLVVRDPDDVAASMARLGHAPWTDAALAHRIWRFYNRRVLSFARTTSVPCAIVDGSLGLADPTAIAQVLNGHLGLTDVRLSSTRATFDHVHEDRFVRDAPRAQLADEDRAASDALWKALRELLVWPSSGRREG